MKKLILSFLGLGLSYLSYSQTTLMAKYDFQSGMASDLSGNGYNGTSFGSPAMDYDRFGANIASLRFYGSGDYIQTTCPGVSGNGNRTISFWAKVAPGAADGGGINYGGGPLGEDFNLAFSNSAGNEGITLDMSDMALTDGMNVPDGQWHQYIVTYNNADGNTISAVKFYRDGILVNNIINSYNPTGHSVNTNTITQVKIGGGDCNMDDIRLFSGSMTALQVDSIYNAEVPQNPYLVARYNFNGNANDGSSSGNNCTVMGATLTTDRYGYANHAYNFNGTSDFIYQQSTVSLIGHPFTIGLWAKRNVIDGNFQVLASQGGASTDQGLHIGLTGTLGSPQHVGIDLYNDGIYDTTYADSVNWNQWYFTYNDASHAANIYLNGQLVHTDISAGGYAGTGGLSFGQAAWGGNFFSGKIDEIKVFGTELSSYQIDSIYQLEKIPNCALGATISNSTNVMCNGGADGQATAAATGAIGPVSYSWAPTGGTSASATGFAAGNYTVTVTDGIGCTAQAIATINNPSPINITLNPTDVSCNGACNGIVNSIVSGGTGTVMLNWTPVGGTQDYASALCPGTYTLTAIDGNGCVGSNSTTIAESTSITVSTTATNVTCYGANDGTVSVSATGGSGSYSYSWSFGSTSMNNAQIPPGIKYVQVTDGNGCSAMDSIMVTQPTQLIVSFTSISSTCGSSNGSITANVSGGTSPYTYLWGDGSNGTSLTNVSSGQYYSEVTDNNGCYIASAGNIDDSNGPSIVLNSIMNVSCSGLANGAIFTTISGGTGPLTIQWYSGYSTDDITNIYAGTYDLVVSDTMGCTAYRSYIVTEPGALYLYGSSVSPSQCGFSDGSADMSVSGGVSPYIYQWDAATGSQTTSTASSISAGAYRVTVTDSNGCIDSSYVSVSDPGGLSISIDSVFQAGCITSTNNGNGSIYISVYNGTGPYDYQWSNGDLTEDVTNLGKGIFGVTVTDQNSACKASASQFIYGIRPGTPQICLVTVDTATNHNIIVWEKDIPGVAKYYIYRQSSTQGQFNLIASIPADSLSTFEDTLANAGIKPWDYEIKIVDSCNVTSQISLTHQSIFLTIAQGSGSSVDLDWTPYVGTPFSAYYIYRRTSSNPWTLIDSTTVGVTMYNDALAPSPIDSIDYLIEIEPTNPCNPSRAAINTSRSNIKNTSRLTNPTGIKETTVETKALVFPNPAQSELNIKVDRKGKFNVQIYDVTGRQVKGISPDLSAQNLAKVNIAEIESGVYILKLVFDDGKVYRTKFVKQ